MDGSKLERVSWLMGTNDPIPREVDGPLNVNSKHNIHATGGADKICDRPSLKARPLAALIDDPQDAIRGIDEHLMTVDEGRAHPPRSRRDLHIIRHDLPGRNRARIAGGMA